MQKAECITHSAPNIPIQLFFFGSKLLNILDQIFAIVIVDFQCDGLAQVQREDAQNGLGIHHMTAGTKVHFIFLAVHSVNKRLHFFGVGQFNRNRLHTIHLPNDSNHIIAIIADILEKRKGFYTSARDAFRRRSVSSLPSR